MQNFAKFQRKLWLVIIPLLATLVACKKDDDNNNNNNNNNNDVKKNYVVQIEQGAVLLYQGESIQYTAVLVDKDGNSTPTSGTWTSNKPEVVEITGGGAATAKGGGEALITVSVKKDGVDLTASAPVGVATSKLFTVNPPGAILFVGEKITLTGIRLTESGLIAQSAYSFTSSAPNVASVSGNEVTAVNPGFAVINASTTIDGTQAIFPVPIWVEGEPQVVLPVTRVRVTPGSKEALINREFQLSAKAFNSAGAEVSEPMTWRSLDEKVATVDQTGKVSTKDTGEVKIQAICKGIIGEATITVYPDTFVYVEPFFATVNKGATKQFTAKVYRITSQELNENSTFVDITSNVPPLRWLKEDYPPGFEMFDVIESVSATGLAKVKANATENMFGTIVAYVPGSKYAYGFATIMVGGSVIGGGGCDDATALEVSTIEAQSSATVSILSGPTTINVQYLDLFGESTSFDGAKAVVANGEICSAALDPVTGNLTITGLMSGSTTVTICASPSVKKDISVTVSF
mgnify:CR=1 FL=1